MALMYVLGSLFLFPLVVPQNEALTTALLFGARIWFIGTFTLAGVYCPEVSVTLYLLRQFFLLSFLASCSISWHGNLFWSFPVNLIDIPCLSCIQLNREFWLLPFTYYLSPLKLCFICLTWQTTFMFIIGHLKLLTACIFMSLSPLFSLMCINLFYMGA